MTALRRLPESSSESSLAHPALPRGQMSHANGFDRRGRAGSRRGHAAAMVDRNEATLFWSALVRRRCPSREACAVQFGVTFQTACNWWDGFSCPGGDKVLTAQRLWPEDFERRAA